MDYHITPTGNAWHSFADELRSDTLLQAAAIDEHRRIYTRCFENDLAANHALPIMTHAFRRLDQWRVFLLLTPWMLARLFVPDADPGLRIPPEWDAQTCSGREYQVIGPAFDLPLLTGKQRAHLNYSPVIGHYLLHPLILSMTNFGAAEEVFAAWNRVIELRNLNLERVQKRNPLQEEITRRELFTGAFRG